MGIRASGPHFPIGLKGPSLISGLPGAGLTCHAIPLPSSQSSTDCTLYLAARAGHHTNSATARYSVTIILWKTQRLAAAFEEVGPKIDVPDGHLQYLSPLGWDHINLTGEYRLEPSVTGESRSVRYFPFYGPSPSCSRGRTSSIVAKSLGTSTGVSCVGQKRLPTPLCQNSASFIRFASASRINAAKALAV